MDESLLGARLAVAEEDDELWNAPPFGDGREAENAAFLSRPAPQQRTATPLPSLRSNVHLPALSSLFQGLAESAKSRLMGPSDTDRSSAAASRPVSNAPDEHGRVANLDAFLITLYNYFYHKGFWSILVVEVVGLFTGLFSVGLSSFLLGCVEWSALLDCQGDTEHGCKPELEDYITCRPANPSLLHLSVAFYFTMFMLYWVFRVVRLVATLRDAREIGAFYWQRLGIDERMLQTVTWDEVVTRVLGLVSPTVNAPRNLKQISSYKLQIDPALLSTPHDVARRIMRRENYLIAFMNHALFQESKLLPTKLHFASVSQVVFSRNIEANLNICLIDQMFDAEQNLALPVLNDEQMMQKRFLVAGILNLALTPFILLYRSSHFLFQSSQEWHMNKRSVYFSSRRWSSYAQWKFREYNELPHALEARMARSYPLAEKYLSMFPAGLVAVIAGGILFCATSLMAVLIFMSLLSESITLYEHPLIWYFAVTTGLFTLARIFTTTESSPFALHGDCEEAMLQLSTETHYFPKEWRGHCSSYDVRDAFVALFPFKIVLFAQECLSVLMAPYILCVSLPQATRELLLFVRSHSLALPNVGAVCRFAEFDFKRYTNDTKMESSFINFKQNHPRWVGAEEGEALMARLGRVKEEEMEMSMRLADTMMFNSQSIPQLSMSQQLMQSQAIQTALGASYGRFPMTVPQENEFYWLEKLHQRGDDGKDGLGDLHGTNDEHDAKGDGSDLALSSVRV